MNLPILLLNLVCADLLNLDIWNVSSCTVDLTRPKVFWPNFSPLWTHSTSLNWKFCPDPDSGVKSWWPTSGSSGIQPRRAAVCRDLRVLLLMILYILDIGSCPPILLFKVSIYPWSGAQSRAAHLSTDRYWVLLYDILLLPRVPLHFVLTGPVRDVVTLMQPGKFFFEMFFVVEKHSGVQ